MDRKTFNKLFLFILFSNLLLSTFIVDSNITTTTTTETVTITDTICTPTPTSELSCPQNDEHYSNSEETSDLEKRSYKKQKHEPFRKQKHEPFRKQKHEPFRKQKHKPFKKQEHKKQEHKKQEHKKQEHKKQEHKPIKEEKHRPIKKQEHKPTPCKTVTCTFTKTECVTPTPICAPLSAPCNTSHPELCCTGLCSTFPRTFPGVGCCNPKGQPCPIFTPG
ncbi:1504_t:CDS:1, partial [Gigaspora margarita]